MTRRNWIWLLLALWITLYAASFIVAHATAPTGDSFLRGMNRLMVFFQYQGLAAVVAVLIWWNGSAFAPRSWSRRLTRAPVGLAVALVLVIVGIVISANIGKPAPDGPPAPQATTTSPKAQ